MTRTIPAHLQPLHRRLASLRRLTTLDRMANASTRDIATRAGLSHNTVACILRAERLPRWESLRAIIVALGGDPADFVDDWHIAALGDQLREPAPPLRYEYMQTSCDISTVADIANQQQTGGWQLLTTMPDPASTTQVHAVFRRRTR